MAAQRSAGRARAIKSAAPKALASTGESVNGDDAEPLTDRAYRMVEELIVTLALPPETILSEQSLAARLKIGRTPIREALQRLARGGLVGLLPRRGILVSQIKLKT